MWTNILSFSGAFVVGLVIASFFEWWVHLLMHRRIVLGKVHTRHHKSGEADGFALEFLYYAAGAVPSGLAIVALGAWLGVIWSAAGVASAGLLYAVFAAYSHQLQHERPELIFWMPQPIHKIHHLQQQWRKNFGISLDVWDRVFGTYEPSDWKPDPTRKAQSWRDYFRIQWI